MSDMAIRIDGLREFLRALKAMEGDLPKMVRYVNNEAASVLVEHAKARMRADGAVRSGRALGSIRAASTQGKGRVKAGGARAPYYGFIDFGGSVGPGKVRGQSNTGSVRRPFLGDGRYIYPAYYQMSDELRQIMLDGLLNVCRTAGLDVQIERA